MSGFDMMGGAVAGTLASSGTSTGALFGIVIGEALIIVLLIVLVVMLRRTVQGHRERAARRADEGFVSGSLEMPTPVPVSEMPPPPDVVPEEPVHVPPPAVSWDMDAPKEEDEPDAESVPIPAFTGPRLPPKTSYPDVDFNLGVEDPPDDAAEDANAAASANGDEEVMVARRSRRGGQAPPPPFT